MFLRRCCTSILFIALFLGSPLASMAGEVKLFGVVQLARSKIHPGGVALIRARVTNKDDEPWSGKLSYVWPTEPQLQVERQLNLAGNQEILLDTPVPIPSAFRGRKTFELELTLRDAQDQITTSGTRPNQSKVQFLPETNPPPITIAASFEDPPPIYPTWYWPPAPTTEQESVEFAIATQVDAGNSRKIISLSQFGLPLSQEEWSFIDLLILSDPIAMQNLAGLQAAKLFVERGGRIWIQLDALDVDLLQPLLSSDQLCEEIDTVELHDFVVHLNDALTEFQEADRRVQSKQAIPMKRVVQSGGKVTHEINGWPAAITFSVGYGQVFVTTLAGDGWMKTRGSQDRDPLRQANYTLQDWGKDFAGKAASVQRNETPLQSELDYPLQRLGVPIISKGWIVAALGLYCLLLAAVAGWRFSTGNLSPIGILAPALAIVLATTMLIGRSFLQSESRESIARFQLIEATNDGLSVHITEHAAVFLKSVQTVELKSQCDGKVWPSSATNSGVFRMSESDVHQWQFQNAGWPAGMSQFRANYSTASESLVATARITQRGIELELPESLSDWEDSILSFVAGDPMIVTRNGKTLASDGAIKIGGQRWITASLMTDEQRRRLEIYERFLGGNEVKTRPQRRVYGWSSAWQLMRSETELEEVGSALIGLPLQIIEPDKGSSLLIPHGLIRFRQSPFQEGSTTAFSDKSGKWQPDLAQPMDRRFVFELPKEVGSISAQSVTLELDIVAPGRNVELFALTEDGEVPIATMESPALPWSKTLKDQDILKAINQGYLEVRLKVSTLAKSNSSRVVPWNIGHFHATVRAEAGER